MSPLNKAWLGWEIDLLEEQARELQNGVAWASTVSSIEETLRLRRIVFRPH